VVDVDERRELRLELFDPSPEDELGGLRHLAKGAVDLLMDRLVLRNEIDKRDYRGIVLAEGVAAARCADARAAAGYALR
jgi:hypothetical protein